MRRLLGIQAAVSLRKQSPGPHLSCQHLVIEYKFLRPAAVLQAMADLPFVIIVKLDAHVPSLKQKDRKDEI